MIDPFYVDSRPITYEDFERVLGKAMNEGACNCGTCPVHPPQCMCHAYSVPDCRPICRVPGHTGLNRLKNLIDYKKGYWQAEKKD